jgi:hypothetical protein
MKFFLKEGAQKELSENRVKRIKNEDLVILIIQS